MRSVHFKTEKTEPKFEKPNRFLKTKQFLILPNNIFLFLLQTGYRFIKKKSFIVMQFVWQERKPVI